MSFIHYDYLIEESLNEVYIFHADTLKFARANRAARQNLGYSMDELQEMTPLDIKPEFTTSAFNELIEPLVAGKNPKIVFSTVHQRRNGTQYDVEVHLQYVTFDDYQVFVAIILDVTELNRIQQYNAGLSEVFHESLNEIYMFDAVTLRFTEVNRGACQNIGYTIEELRQMTPLDIKPNMTREAFANLIMPLRLGEQEKVIFTTMHRRKDGTEYPTEIHLQLSQFDSKPTFVAIILDITERKSQEKATLDLAMKSERMYIMKQFIDNTSHEFSTPLSVINTKLYLLKKIIDNPDAIRHISILDSQVKKLEELVKGLQQLTELDTITTVPTKAVNICLLIQDINNNLQKKFSHKAHNIIFNIADDVRIIEADQPLITLAIRHILQNAFIFTPTNGHITINAFIKDMILNLNISDTGIGIDEAEQKRIFERLYRVDSSRNTDTGGAGLGLAIVKRIIELHNGTISVKSRIGEGTCFCLQLPVQQDHENPKFTMSLEES